MLPYFKRYTIYVCIIAVALPVVVSTVWPLLTGHIMASSILGLVLLFALFVAGLLLGYRIFGNKADKTAEMHLDRYNDDCDPEALVNGGAEIAGAIAFPCIPAGAWYMGYYAQALLDMGRVEEAREIEEGIASSVPAVKKDAMKVGIIVNLLPLKEKIHGTEAAIQLVDEGLAICSQSTGAVTQEEEFLKSQKTILEARMSGDARKVSQLDEKIRSNAQYPMRIRVEYAWDAASAEYKLGNASEEKTALEFVADHGNKLALVAKAKARLENVRF